MYGDLDLEGFFVDFVVKVCEVFFGVFGEVVSGGDGIDDGWVGVVGEGVRVFDFIEDKDLFGVVFEDGVRDVGVGEIIIV